MINFQLNNSMQTTKSERKSDRFTAITRGLIIVFLVQVFLGVLTVLLALLCSLSLDISPQVLLNNDYFNTYVSLYTSLMMTLVTLAFSKFVENRSLASLGLESKNVKKPVLYGSVIGSVLAIIIFLFNSIFQPSLAINIQPDSHTGHFFLFFLGYILFAASEEVFYRGYLMNALSVEGDIFQAIIINSLIYGIVSAVTTQFSIIHFVNSFLLSMIFSYLFYISDHLFTSIFANAAWLIIFNLIFGTPTHSTTVPYSLFTLTASEVNSAPLNISRTLYTTFILGIILFGTHLWTKLKKTDTKS